MPVDGTDIVFMADLYDSCLNVRSSTIALIRDAIDTNDLRDLRLIHSSCICQLTSKALLIKLQDYILICGG